MTDLSMAVALRELIAKWRDASAHQASGFGHSAFARKAAWKQAKEECAAELDALLASVEPPPQEHIEFRDVLSIEGDGPFYVTLHDADEALSVQGFDVLTDAEAFHELLADALNHVLAAPRATPTQEPT